MSNVCGCFVLVTPSICESDNPCQNAAQCVSGTLPQQYACQCSSGYTGVYCENGRLTDNLCQLKYVFNIKNKYFLPSRYCRFLQRSMSVSVWTVAVAFVKTMLVGSCADVMMALLEITVNLVRFGRNL